MDEIITRVERENNIPVGRTKMMAAIESAEGVLNAREIAKASDRLIGIALGAEDYVTNMKLVVTLMDKSYSSLVA